MEESSPLLQDPCCEFCCCQVIIDPVEAGERCHEAELFSVFLPEFLSICHIKLLEFKIVNIVFPPAELDHVMRKITPSNKTRFTNIAECTLQ